MKDKKILDLINLVKELTELKIAYIIYDTFLWDSLALYDKDTNELLRLRVSLNIEEGSYDYDEFIELIEKRLKDE